MIFKELTRKQTVDETSERASAELARNHNQNTRSRDTYDLQQSQPEERDQSKDQCRSGTSYTVHEGGQKKGHRVNWSF